MAEPAPVYVLHDNPGQRPLNVTLITVEVVLICDCGRVLRIELNDNRRHKQTCPQCGERYTARRNLVDVSVKRSKGGRDGR